MIVCQCVVCACSKHAHLNKKNRKQILVTKTLCHERATKRVPKRSGVLYFLVSLELFLSSLFSKILDIFIFNFYSRETCKKRTAKSEEEWGVNKDACKKERKRECVYAWLSYSLGLLGHWLFLKLCLYACVCVCMSAYVFGLYLGIKHALQHVVVHTGGRHRQSVIVCHACQLLNLAIKSVHISTLQWKKDVIYNAVKIIILYW